MADYQNVKKSRLAFKGSKPIKKFTSSKLKSETLAVSSSSSSSVGHDHSSGHPDDEQEAVAEAGVAEEEEEIITVQQGSGRISSSGTTIQGHEGTKFMSELSVGDAIIVNHPQSFADETKIVKMVLSNVSISISSAFSTDLISTAPFRYVKAPKPRMSTEEAAPSSSSTRMNKFKVDPEEAAYGQYASNGGEKFTYRVKKAGAHGTYQIITEDLKKKGGSAVTREDLLFMRSKKKSDRHCS